MKKTLLLGAALAALAGCTPDKALEQATAGPSGSAAKPAAPAPDAGAAAFEPPPLPRMEFSENDFAESDRNRDPFRTFASVLAPDTKKVAQAQYQVILPQFSLDELKLAAIVTGGDYPRAMVIDPGGKGWVLKRGDWVGRPEVVHVGGANGADYQITWRVDKVREGEIVFLREDPAQPGVPPASRVIAIRSEQDNQREKL